jgi:hypothetical protein
MPNVREEFKLELKNRFSVLSTQKEDADIETSWKAIKNVYIETSEKILGFIENIGLKGNQQTDGKRKCKQKQKKTKETYYTNTVFRN